MKILDAKQEAKLNMYQVVQALCDANDGIVKTNIAFQSAFADFKAKIAQIVAAAEMTSSVLTGIAADKSVSKQDLSVIAAAIAGLIYAYAAKTTNNTLKQAVNFSLSDISKLKDAEIGPRCQNIHESGVANLAALADFGVTSGKLADLQTAIDAYAAQISKPRTAITERSTIKANIRQYFKDADAILVEQMDKLVIDFKTDNRDFVKNYKSARIIVDPASTTTKLVGTVTDKADGTPIAGATITATGTTGPTAGITKTATTAATGRYTIKPLPPGDYTVTAKADGFNDFTETPVKATMGANNHFDVALENS